MFWKEKKKKKKEKKLPPISDPDIEFRMPVNNGKIPFQARKFLHKISRCGKYQS